MNFAVLFPGQGAQTAGFLHEFPGHSAVRATFDQASELLDKDVLNLDTETSLRSTVTTQLVLVVAGAAFTRFCEAEHIQPVAVAGMSVGAFTAALAAGAIDLSTALKLVRYRAESMEAAFPPGTHGMLAVDGLRLSGIKKLVEGSSVAVANYNSATQHVLAGGIVELAELQARAKDAGAHSVKMLRMSVASHTPELLPAAERLLAIARTVRVDQPRIAIYSSRTARPLATADSIREDLALNMAYPVRWYDTITAIGSRGIELFVEAPPGHALSRLTTEVLPDASCIAAGETRWDVILRAVRRGG